MLSKVAATTSGRPVAREADADAGADLFVSRVRVPDGSSNMLRMEMNVTVRLGWLLLAGLSASGATTIDPGHRHAYGANIGWLDLRADTNNGTVVGEFVCSGYLYSANAGWIHLGDGTPENGIRYLNGSSTDYGVNHDGLGNLRGYAWGANIGWIQFENQGAPRVNLFTGRLSGSIYSANCGWISLSNAAAYVQTTAIQPGADADQDKIPDAWEWTHSKFLTDLTASGDADGDGVPDVDEYRADTNPFDPNDHLRILSIARGPVDPTYTTLVWTSRPSRFYAIENRGTLNPAGAWTEFFALPFPGVSAVGFNHHPETMFYRIRAFRPLTP